MAVTQARLESGPQLEGVGVMMAPKGKKATYAAEKKAAKAKGAGKVEEEEEEEEEEVIEHDSTCGNPTYRFRPLHSKDTSDGRYPRWSPLAVTSGYLSLAV